MSSPPVDALILKRNAWEAPRSRTNPKRSNIGDPMMDVMPGSIRRLKGQIHAQRSMNGPSSRDAMTVFKPTSGPRKKYARIRRKALSINTIIDTFIAIPADSSQVHITIASPEIDPRMRLLGIRK